MKRSKVFTFMTAMAVTTLVACNNDADTTAGNDSSNAGTTPENTATTNTSTGAYSAMADSFRLNSDAGKYRDARTGSPIKINVDQTTGAKMNAETNQPIDRYIYVVDDSDWWVYDNAGTQLGRAKMDNDKLLFEDDSKWVEYDMKWKADDGGLKGKGDDIKIKTEKDGDTKIKVGDKKIKADEDGVKIKE